MTQSLLSAVLGWLRAGYPEGVPDQDYVPLLALLRRRLSDEEILQVQQILVHRDAAVDNVDIGVQITKITDELPRDEDINRVRGRLAAAGWPLGDPTHE